MLHFNDDDFVNRHNIERLKLRRRAIPSIFVDADKPKALEYVACGTKSDLNDIEEFYGECGNENDDDSVSCENCHQLTAKLKYVEDKYKQQELEVLKLKDEINMLKSGAKTHTPLPATSSFPQQSPLSPQSPPSRVSSPFPMDIGAGNLLKSIITVYDSVITPDVGNCIKEEAVDIDDDVKPIIDHCEMIDDSVQVAKQLKCKDFFFISIFRYRQQQQQQISNCFNIYYFFAILLKAKRNTNKIPLPMT